MEHAARVAARPGTKWSQAPVDALVQGRACAGRADGRGGLSTGEGACAEAPSASAGGRRARATSVHNQVGGKGMFGRASGLVGKLGARRAQPCAGGSRGPSMEGRAGLGAMPACTVHSEWEQLLMQQAASADAAPSAQASGAHGARRT